MKTKVDLKVTLSLNRKAMKREIQQLVEVCANLLDVQELYDIEINPGNQPIPLMVEHHFVEKLTTIKLT